MAKLRKPSTARTAYLQQTLVAFDGPQLALFKSDRGFPVLALAVDEPTEDTYRMLAVEITEETLRRYLNQKVDLRFVYLDAAKRHYYINWASLNQQGWLPLTRIKEEIPEAYLPDHGFWSRNHTIDYGVSAFASETLASFAIDGSWDASDFSRFYGKFADLYAFLTIGTKRLVSEIPASALAAIKTAISSAGWRGGGSYVGFYDAMFSRIDQLSPLRVNRIQYASPGTIELKGNPKALSEVAEVINAFAADEGEIKNAYDFVHKLLGQEDLRTAKIGSRFSSDQIKDAALEKCHLLNSSLGVDAPDQILDLCNRDVVIYSKITLSFYRRARDLHAFHAEGRVAANKNEGVEEQIEA